MIYAYDKSKDSRRIHILNNNGFTYCKVENGRRRKEQLITTDIILPDRKLCVICQNLKSRHKNDNFNGDNKKKKGFKKNSLKKTANDFYKSDEWARLRFKILKDADKCLCCGATKKEARLTVDHVIPLWKRPDLQLNESNMQVLCMLCNKGKGGRDETDFRSQDNQEDIDETLDLEHLTNVVSLYE